VAGIAERVHAVPAAPSEAPKQKGQGKR